MLAKYKPEQFSAVGLITGALIGALLGALISLIAMNSRSAGQREHAKANLSNYLRLGLAMVMLVRQTSELLARSPKQQA
jgi:gas vesicle protein